MQRLQQTLPLPQNQLCKIQRARQCQQAWPRSHRDGDAAAGGVENVAWAEVEASPGRVCDLFQQVGVVAVFHHFVFLAVEADFGEGARFGERAHTEQTLRLTDVDASA